MSNPKVKVGYMCGVAWQHELGETDVIVYGSEAELRENADCTDECGVVKVEVKLVKWVKPQKLLEEHDYLIHYIAVRETIKGEEWNTSGSISVKATNRDSAIAVARAKLYKLGLSRKLKIRILYVSRGGFICE